MIKLNLGRNCLKIIIRTYGIKEIFIPYYSCKTIWQSVREENCKIRFYHIDENFMPADEFNQNDFILYINYFGLFENNVKKLCQKYKNIILDNTQSFYSQHQGIASFNSLRKFFPVQNGAYLFGIDKITENFQDDELKLELEENNIKSIPKENKNHTDISFLLYQKIDKFIKLNPFYKIPLSEFEDKINTIRNNSNNSEIIALIIPFGILFKANLVTLFPME